jgi:hypothetical protein
MNHAGFMTFLTNFNKLSLDVAKFLEAWLPPVFMGCVVLLFVVAGVVVVIALGQGAWESFQARRRDKKRKADLDAIRSYAQSIGFVPNGPHSSRMYRGNWEKLDILGSDHWEYFQNYNERKGFFSGSNLHDLEAILTPEKNTMGLFM